MKASKVAKLTAERIQELDNILAKVPIPKTNGAQPREDMPSPPSEAVSWTFRGVASKRKDKTFEAVTWFKARAMAAAYFGTTHDQVMLIKGPFDNG